MWLTDCRVNDYFVFVLESGTIITVSCIFRDQNNCFFVPRANSTNWCVSKKKSHQLFCILKDQNDRLLFFPYHHYFTHGGYIGHGTSIAFFILRKVQLIGWESGLQTKNNLIVQLGSDGYSTRFDFPFCGLEYSTVLLPCTEFVEASIACLFLAWGCM
jgi:hypothetical protein